MFLYDHVIPLVTTGIRRLKARTGTREIFRKPSEIQRKYSKPSYIGFTKFLLKFGAILDNFASA